LPEAGKGALARRGFPARPDPTHNPPQHEEARDPGARRYVDILSSFSVGAHLAENDGCFR
tara:strand:+ start:1121 stop:1300 length:180 start_codon:yes stop_codon:yes gene_type:complete